MSVFTPKHPGFLVWNPSGPPSPGYRHRSLDEAQMEAKRLAKLHPGQPFYVLAPVGLAYAEQPEPGFFVIPPKPFFEDDDEIPF